MNKSVRIAAAAVVLLLAGAGIAYRLWTRTPQYALRQAAKAAQEHDLPAFRKYVDTEKVTARFVDDMLASVTEEAEKEQFGGLAAGMVMMMRPQMVKAAQDALERGIETGQFEEEKGDNPAEAAAPYWREAGENESGYRRIAYVKKQGKIAVAGLEMYDADLRMPFTLELKLRDLGSHWQVVEIANLRAVQKAIEQGTAKRLEELNAPIRRQMAEAIRFESLKGSARSGSWGFDQESVVEAQIRNLSAKTVAEVRFAVRFTMAGETIGTVQCVEDDDIPPGGQERGVWSEDANRFLEADMKLYNGIERAQAAAEIERVAFTDGTTLELVRELPRAAKSGSVAK